MIALSVHAAVVDGSELERLVASARSRALRYMETPGLLHKAFVYSLERKTYGAHYLWADEASADVFLASAQFKSMADAFPQVEIERFSVAAVIDRLDEADSVDPILRHE